MVFKLLEFDKPSCYSEHLAVVMYNSTYAIVFSWVRKSGCSWSMNTNFCISLPRWVITTFYFWLKQNPSNLLQGHMKHFCLYLRHEQSTSGWKAAGYSQNRYPVTLQTNWDKLEQLFMWPCSNVPQIDKKQVYSILSAMWQDNARRNM